jgi:predicted MPP superfamily phosphohydrolase
MKLPNLESDERAVLEALDSRLGHGHVSRRLGIERDYEAGAFRKETSFFDFGNWPSANRWIRTALQLTGLYRRGRRNALSIGVRYNDAMIAELPSAFENFTILQLSDLHIDMTPDFLGALLDTIRPLRYDLCVLTGDYRAQLCGSYDAALEGMNQLRPHIHTTAYAVLGNHDTIRMVPPMESMGFSFLINEHVSIERDDEELYVAGVDDAHFYRLADFQRAAHGIPRQAISVLLSHTPEPYREAAHAEFDLMLCGHTHGGQICLPGGIPVLTEADCPLRFTRGAWRYDQMLGYTSAGAGTCIVDARLNCPAEVTLHRLLRADPIGSVAPRPG